MHPARPTRSTPLHVLVAAGVCLLLALSGRALAQSVEGQGYDLSGTNTLDLEVDTSHKEEGEDAHNHLRDLLDLFLTAGDMNIGATVAVQNYYPAYPSVSPGWESGLRKIFIEVHKPSLSFTAGDMFSALGNGLTLSVLKDDTILLDDTILGGKGSVKTGPLSLTGLGGYVEDELTAETDWVAGAEAVATLWDGWEFAARYSYVGDKNKVFLDGSIHTATAGLRKSLFGGRLDFNGEAGFMKNTERESFANGHGVYLAATVGVLPSWTTLVEYKDYYLFDNKYNNPPLADYEDQVNDLEDIRGINVKHDFSVSKLGTNFSVSTGYFDKVLKDSEAFQLVFKGERYDLFGRLYLNMTYGYRWDLFNTSTFDLDSTLSLTERNSIEVHLLLRTEFSDIGEVSENEFSVGFARSPTMSFFFLWQHATREVIGRNDFFGGEATLTLTDALDLNLFYGQTKGGKVCSGGICRWEPPFSGVKVRTTYRF